MALFYLGVPVCHASEQHTQYKDHGTGTSKWNRPIINVIVTPPLEVNLAAVRKAILNLSIQYVTLRVGDSTLNTIYCI